MKTRWREETGGSEAKAPAKTCLTDGRKCKIWEGGGNMEPSHRGAESLTQSPRCLLYLAVKTVSSPVFVFRMDVDGKAWLFRRGRCFFFFFLQRRPFVFYDAMAVLTGFHGDATFFSTRNKLWKVQILVGKKEIN